MSSEWEKMVAGEMYDPRDPALVEARRRARRLLREYQATDEAQTGERERILRALLGSAGEGVWIEPPFFCDYGTNIHTGRNVYFNFNCVVLDVAPVTIGDRVMFGPAVQIYTATHPLDAEERSAGLESGRAIEIGDDAWIGGGSVLLPGVRIGARSVVGAGSVVTRDLPADVLAAGNPCRIIRRLGG